jgi:hypothetical protein
MCFCTYIRVVVVVHISRNGKELASDESNASGILK